jgi:hypothetical protein
LTTIPQLLWLKPIGALAIMVVGLLVLNRNRSYSLNQLFSLSFLLFGFCWFFDFLKDFLWVIGYSAVLASRYLTIFTGIFASICFLLTGINVRYGTSIAFSLKFLLPSLVTGLGLSIVAILYQVVLPVPDPVEGTVILMELPALFALFIIPTLFTLVSVSIIISAALQVETPAKKRSLLLIAFGILFLSAGAISYALQGFFSASNPSYDLIRITLGLFTLSIWLIGSLLCLFAFRRAAE